MPLMTTAPEPQTPPLAEVAFAVGVTGHRNPRAEDITTLRAQVGAELAALRRHLDGTPVVLMTGLAAGADMLAAEAAIDAGIGVDAVLPMPRTAYESDFSAAELAAFCEIVRNPLVRVREIPLAPSVTPEALARDQALRDAQYARLGDYLRRRSNLMIALWDGARTELTGGTGEVVLGYLADATEGHIAEMASAAAPDDCGNVVAWIATPRAGSGQKTGPTRYLVSTANHDCYATFDSPPAAVIRRWEAMAAFHDDLASSQGRNLTAYPLGDAPSPDLAAIDLLYQRADQLARAAQDMSNRLFRYFALIAGAMGLAFLAYAKLWAEPAFLVVYVLLFFAGYAGFRFSARMHLHGRHLACRVLAETLRVQYFLTLSGAGAAYSLRRLLDLTSVARFERFEWLPEALRAAEPLVYDPPTGDEDAIARVRGDWIVDQRDYFSRKLHKLHHEHERLARFKTALLGGSVLGALALIFMMDELHHMEMAGHDGKVWLVFLMGLLPLWAAIWELYHGKMATRELLWQYANQRRFFATAETEIAMAKGPEAERKVIRDLADKALIEIYLWSVHRFHREHEPPSAG